MTDCDSKPTTSRTHVVQSNNSIERVYSGDAQNEQPFKLQNPKIKFNGQKKFVQDPRKRQYPAPKPMSLHLKNARTIQQAPAENQQQQLQQQQTLAQRPMGNDQQNQIEYENVLFEQFNFRRQDWTDRAYQCRDAIGKFNQQNSKMAKGQNGNSYSGFDAASVYTQPSSNVKTYSGMGGQGDTLQQMRRGAQRIGTTQRNHRRKNRQNFSRGNSRGNSVKGVMSEMNKVPQTCRNTQVSQVADGQELLHHITEPNLNIETNKTTVNELSSAPPIQEPLQNDQNDLLTGSIQDMVPNSSMPQLTEREGAHSGNGNRILYDQHFFNQYHRSGKKTMHQTPNKTAASQIEMTTTLNTFKENLTKSTNFLNRRLRQRQKVYGGTQELVSPNSYRMKELTGSKKIFEGKYKQGPQHSFGKEDTGRTEIQNNHNNFFNLYNYQSIQSQKHLARTLSEVKSYDKIVAESNPVAYRQISDTHKQSKASLGTVMLKQMSGPLQSANIAPGNSKSLMYFYRTSNLQNPGSGDYVTENAILNLKKKSPRATIGNEKRFYETNEQMIRNYKDPIPFQHIEDAAQQGNRKPQMGSIGNAQRLNPNRFVFNSPGVGTYEMSAYTSLAKAKQGTYVTLSNEKTRNYHKTKKTRSVSNMDSLDQNNMVKGKHSRNSTSLGVFPNTARASKPSRKNKKTTVTSAADNLQMYDSFNKPSTRSSQQFTGQRSHIQLGGPSTVNKDRMNLCSREARDMVFTHEHHKSFNGRGVPGPAEYHTNRISSLNTKYASGTKSTVPKTRRDVGYTKFKIERNMHMGVAHLTNKFSHPSFNAKFSKFDREIMRNTSCENMVNHDGPASQEAIQMSYVLAHGKPSICYEDQTQHVRLLKQKTPKATIGNFQDRFDPAKMGQLNGKEWSKGLKYI